MIPIFVYRAMKDLPFNVYRGHKRIFDYVSDTVVTMANICDSFHPGEVYNIGSHQEWVVDIGELSDMVLRLLDKDDSRVTYKEAEPFTTHTKIVDSSKAEKHLGHSPQVDLEEGLSRYIEWMKSVYGDGAEGRR